jgi:hypothetical protein
VWDEPGGLANRSGAGDLDVVVYSARKWCRLALEGNPTVLLALFVPDKEVVVVHRMRRVRSWSTMSIASCRNSPLSGQPRSTGVKVARGRWRNDMAARHQADHLNLR